MNKLSKIFIITIILAVFGLILWQLPSDLNTESDAKIATTIFPIYDIARNITGEAMSVELILPAGASPHTYEPTPSDIRSLTNVEVVYAIGYEFDDWATLISESVGAEIMMVDSDIEIRESNEETDSYVDEIVPTRNEIPVEDLDDHGEFDSHYWLTIQNASKIATTIANDLSERYPESADVFADNLSSYLHQLNSTETQIQNLLSPIENKNLITMHDAWYYFAEEYGLEVAGTFEPTAGREPTPQYLIELMSQIESAGVSTIYSEPQLDNTPLESFVSDNNVNLAVLDPVGGVEGRQSYIELMLYNAQTIANNQ